VQDVVKLAMDVAKYFYRGLDPNEGVLTLEYVGGLCDQKLYDLSGKVDIRDVPRIFAFIFHNIVV
jgi:hypothetical protein